jgi:hypothetical protein
VSFGDQEEGLPGGLEGQKSGEDCVRFRDPTGKAGRSAAEPREEVRDRVPPLCRARGYAQNLDGDEKSAADEVGGMDRPGASRPPQISLPLHCLDTSMSDPGWHRKCIGRRTASDAHGRGGPIDGVVTHWGASMRTYLRHKLRPMLKQHPRIWQSLIALDAGIERGRMAAAVYVPSVVRPAPRNLEIAITSHCNLRCVGCRYGRDFMTGTQLTWEMVRDLLDDAKAMGIWNVRFYGGEPLLHADLPRMIAHAASLGLQTYVTTNAILLKQKIDPLYAAGLRALTIGYYGTGEKYDAYVQRRNRFGRLEDGIAAVRERYGADVYMRISWLLMRPPAISTISMQPAASPSATEHRSRSISSTIPCRISAKARIVSCSSPRTTRQPSTKWSGTWCVERSKPRRCSTSHCSLCGRSRTGC